MSQLLNTQLLAGMLKSKRADKGLRATANEIGGISIATLSRLEQGKVPDVDTFMRICKWLDVPTDYFSENSQHISVPESNKSRIIAHLRAERELGSDTIDTIVKLINMAYEFKGLEK
jgi:transcriptional regulator with XRE-family HTH domain